LSGSREKYKPKEEKNMTLKNALLLITAVASFALAQNKPKVAVYVTGGKTAAENQALGARITDALVNSGRYNIIERSDVFLNQIAKEMTTRRSGAIDDKQISELGRQAGANFVCVGGILEVFGAHQVSARIINVETAEVVASGLASGSLKTMDGFEALSGVCL
jgi:curli biogenesis system outer membrane secretion channel CsgG